MYFLDFAKTLWKKENTGVIIYLILNTIIVISLFGGSPENLMGFLVGILLYLTSIIIALSPLGEWLLRVQQGCKPIVRKDHIERLLPLFNEVYERAKKIDPTIPNDVKLFISNDKESNAFATGRKTICLTEGFLQFSDEKIKATLAHEFGHLSNKDTDLVLIIAVGNMIVTTMFIIYRVFFYMAAFTAGIMYRSLAPIIITFFVDVILVAFMWLWTKVGTLMVMHSTRQKEYLADDFARRCGYGNELSLVLDDFNRLGYKNGKGLWANLAASHPDPNERIAKLETAV